MNTKLADAYDLIAEGFATAALELRANGTTRAPDAPGDELSDLPFTDTPAGRSEAGGCPVHGIPWSVRPAGNSTKTGAPYNAFWKCDGQDPDGTYCRNKPTPAWVKAHPAR